MTSALHFFEYLDYDKISKLPINYISIKPKKSHNNIYISNLKEPIKFYLPKSSVANLYKDDYDSFIVDYIINEEEHSDFIEFLEHLDSLCIEQASINSHLWFNQELNEETLIKYYNSIYTIEEIDSSESDDTGEQILLPINIDKADIDTIHKYNQNDSDILLVKITGIEFFKKTFRWKLEYEEIIYELDENDGYESDEIDFSKIIQKDGSESESESDLEAAAEAETNEVQIEQNASTENCEIDIHENLEKDKIMNNATIVNLAKQDTQSTIEEIANLENSNIKLNKQALDEITSIISLKKTEAEKYKINSQRAQKASESLSLKVESVNNEISLYEEKLRVLTQPNN
jgi:hypothetical protein